MRKLLFIWVMLLVAGAATAQDVITTKKNEAVRCIVDDVVGSEIVFRTTPLGPAQKLALNLLTSVFIADTLKRTQLESKSVILSELIVIPVDSTHTPEVPEIPKLEGKDLIQKGGRQIYKGAGQLLIGTFIGLATSSIVAAPAIALSSVALPIAIVGGAVSLGLNLTGFINIRNGGKAIQEGAGSL